MLKGRDEGRLLPGRERVMWGVGAIAGLALATVSASAGVCPPTAFEHDGVELFRWMCLDEFRQLPEGALIGAGNDIWGYTSPSGREYAMMGFDAATAFVEITDPTSPSIVEIIPHPSSPSVWSDMKTYGTYGYVVTDGNGGGLQIINLSSIDDGVVTWDATYTGPLFQRFTTAHNVAIDETSGYCALIALRGGAPAGVQGFMLVDLSLDPLQPDFLVNWTDRSVHDLQIVTYDEGAYAGHQIAFVACSGSGLSVLDVTGGTVTPIVMDLTYPHLTYCHQCWISADKKWCFVDDELDEGGASAVTTTTVFDISDLDKVTYFGQFTSGLPSTDHNLMLRGPFVYEANYRSGLRVFDTTDMSSPAAIEQIGYFDTHPGSNAPGFLGAWGVYAAFPSGTVIVSDMQRGLFVLDPVAAVAPVYADGTVPPLDDPGASRGAAWGDADGDGDMDLFVTNDGAGNRLFRNDAGTFVDMTPAVLRGVDESQSAVWGDMDADGDADLYVTVNGAANRLFRNDGGVLADVTASPVDDIADSRTACWVDVDRDGDLDLFVANRNDPSRLFVNDGAGGFSTIELGPESGRAMGAAWADYDLDGDPDLALARVGEANNLYTNQGDGTFTLTIVDGHVSHGVSTGVAWGDVDRDGDFDLLFANAGSDIDAGQENTLLRNDDGIFVDATEAMSLGGAKRTMSVGWGDFDRDGWLDIFASDLDDGVRLYRNAEGEFLDTPVANFPNGGSVYGIGLADVDGNGGIDVYAANSTGPNHLYMEQDGQSTHWLAVALEGSVSNGAGIGARVEVWAGGERALRQIEAGSGYLSQHAPIAHVGLGGRSVADSVLVVWPSGWRSRETNVAADQLIVLNELDATPIDDHPEPLPPGAAPAATRLYAATPNPFNPRTRLVFDLDRAGAVRLDVYDVGGRRVRALVRGDVREVGRHVVVWDGRDGLGREVASGTYFFRLEANGVRETRRATLLK